MTDYLARAKELLAEAERIEPIRRSTPTARALLIAEAQLHATLAVAEGLELRKRVEALAEEWEGWARTRSTPRIDTFRDAAESLRDALGDDRG